MRFYISSTSIFLIISFLFYEGAWARPNVNYCLRPQAAEERKNTSANGKAPPEDADRVSLYQDKSKRVERRDVSAEEMFPEENWESPKKILKKHEGANRLPETAEHVINESVTERELKQLALDAQTNQNRAAYYLLRIYAERMMKDLLPRARVKYGQSFEIDDVDYDKTLRSCIRHYKGKGSFWIYLRVSLDKGFLQVLASRQRKMKSLAQPSKDETLARGEILEDDVEFQRYLRDMKAIHPLSEGDVKELRALLVSETTLSTEESLVEYFLRVYLSGEDPRTEKAWIVWRAKHPDIHLRRIWRTIAETPRLRRVFEDAGFNIDNILAHVDTMERQRIDSQKKAVAKYRKKLEEAREARAKIPSVPQHYELLQKKYAHGLSEGNLRSIAQKVCATVDKLLCEGGQITAKRVADTLGLKYTRISGYISVRPVARRITIEIYNRPGDRWRARPALIYKLKKSISATPAEPPPTPIPKEALAAI